MASGADTYTTDSLDLAAFLIAEGWECREIKWKRHLGRSPEAAFIFDNHDDLMEDVEAWDERTAVTEPKNLLITFTQLRKQMLDERQAMMGSRAG